MEVLKAAVADWWRDWVNMAMLNLGWMLCWITVVLGPPATFTAYRIAHDFVRGGSLYPREVPGMFRRYFLTAWLWFIVNVLVALAVLVNFNFYGTLGGSVGPLLQGATLAVGGIWLLMQFYALPYLMVQERPALLQALRNALLTSLASPFYTVVMGTACALLLFLCVRFPFLLFFGVPMLIAVLGSHAVRERLDTFGKTGGSTG